ncbi:hypothetical protein AAZX31_17G011600 [Glycine max]|uniref:Uncharacterized protein n=1 Tax=Glycine max TaxID=3847 RepID=A0A0R0FG91_SOYBN|nr:hypothetical protein GYH30_045886 [Glycine max]KRH02040.1 hypothetical protein GLYMA_17G011900v4 [Glycine max]
MKLCLSPSQRLHPFLFRVRTTTNNGEQSFTVVLKSNYLAVEGGIYIWC